MKNNINPVMYLISPALTPEYRPLTPLPTLLCEHIFFLLHWQWFLALTVPNLGLFWLLIPYLLKAAFSLLELALPCLFRWFKPEVPVYVLEQLYNYPEQLLVEQLYGNCWQPSLLLEQIYGYDWQFLLLFEQLYGYDWQFL